MPGELFKLTLLCCLLQGRVRFFSIAFAFPSTIRRSKLRRFDTYALWTSYRFSPDDFSSHPCCSFDRPPNPLLDFSCVPAISKAMSAKNKNKGTSSDGPPLGGGISLGGPGSPINQGGTR